jgi:hypothetical protein
MCCIIKQDDLIESIAAALQYIGYVGVQGLGGLATVLDQPLVSGPGCWAAASRRWASNLVVSGKSVASDFMPK